MHDNRERNRRAIRASVAIGALLLAGLAGCTTTGGMSDKDGWLTKQTAKGVVKAMERKGFMPATMDCRFDDNTPGQLAYGSKFTWKRFPKNARWHGRSASRPTLRATRSNPKKPVFTACFTRTSATTPPARRSNARSGRIDLERLTCGRPEEARHQRTRHPLHLADRRAGDLAATTRRRLRCPKRDASRRRPEPSV